MFSDKALILVFLIFSLLISIITTLSFSGFAKSTTIHSDLTLKISPVLSLSLSNCDSTNSSTLNLSIDPTPNGSFKSNCQTTNIHTNTPGYSLTISSSTSTLNYLNPTTITNPPTINSTTNTITSPNILTNDTWGFAAVAKPNFDTTYTPDNPNNKYAALPTTNTTIYQTDQYPLPQTNHTFYYATRLTPTTMAGTYVATITYTAIASNIPEPPNYLRKVIRENNITTMQQLTPTICSNALYDSTNNGINTNNTVILTDTRNNQQYRVRKMPDNKCWMIDNLKLATPGRPLTLTSEDTNLAQGETFVIPAEQAVSHSNTTPTWNDPSTTEACANNTATNGDTYTYNPDSLTKCGYLYNWYAATAGTGTVTMTTGDAESSICPVNWHLPSAGDGTATVANEFAVLNGAMVGTGPSMANNEATQLNWRQAGLFDGTYAGNWDEVFSSQGVHGAYWSSSVYSTYNASYPSFDYNNIYPGSSYGTKSRGLPIRCSI